MMNSSSLLEFGTPVSNTTKIPTPSGIKFGHILVGCTVIGLSIYAINIYYKHKYNNGIKIIKK